MMGERRVMQEALFCGFSLERHVPDNHMLRGIDRFVDVGTEGALEPLLHRGRTALDRSRADDAHADRLLLPGIRSERRLWVEASSIGPIAGSVAWGFDGNVPDHSTFSKNRHGRFRDSDLLRARW
jgi:hypothetical protein